MEPYWRDEKHGLEIYHGDCLEVLPTLTKKADCFVSDPFYGVDGGRGGQAREHGKARYEAEDWEDTPAEVKRVAVPAVQWCIEHTERGAVTPGKRCMRLYPDAADVGCFWAPASSGLGPWGFSVFRPILYYGRDPRAGRGPLPSGIVQTRRAEESEHPCPKPLDGWMWLVRKVAIEGETVLDPFVGVGTTLVCCHRHGLRGVGIEISEEYCELAARRLEAEIREGRGTSQGELFSHGDARCAPKQKVLMGAGDFGETDRAIQANA